jgi:hypothetical protein
MNVQVHNCWVAMPALRILYRLGSFFNGLLAIAQLTIGIGHNTLIHVPCWAQTRTVWDRLLIETLVDGAATKAFWVTCIILLVSRPIKSTP